MKEFQIKKQLTLLKMCVTSLLCVPRADLWPFYWFLCKRFSLYIKVGHSSEEARLTPRRKTAVNSLQQPQSPPNSAEVTHDSSPFHSLSCFKTLLHWERIKGRKSLQPFTSEAIDWTSAWTPLTDSDTAWDSNYSHSGWETVFCSSWHMVTN